ncbi:MAG: dihydrodipicolinate synthase family protein [Bacteroidales bacterium]|nr:dihydrodipicolinate synthase family protein [Bacteroidales bacterium]
MKIEMLNGLVAAPFTPMDEKGNLNLDQIDKYADLLIRNKIMGIFVCGTTGESFSMTTEERKQVLEKWIKVAGKKLRIICHVGSNCLKESKELASHAQSQGAYAIGCISPMFFKPSNARDLMEFLKTVAASAPELPFFYYHFPALTGIDIKASEIFKLASSVPNFAGVKFTHSDFYDMQKCLAFDGGRFNVLNGFDEMLICGLSLGVKAAVGSTYNFMAPLYHDIWEAFSSGDLTRARELQQFSVRVVDILVKYRGSTVAGKAIMDLLGIDCGPCRLPLNTLSEIEKAHMKEDLNAIEFFERAGIKD